MDVLVPPVFPSSTRHRPIAQSLDSEHCTPNAHLPPFRLPKSTHISHPIHTVHISISRAQSPIRTSSAANPESAPTAGKYCKALSLCSVPARYSPPPRSSPLVPGSGALRSSQVLSFDSLYCDLSLSHCPPVCIRARAASAVCCGARPSLW